MRVHKIFNFVESCKYNSPQYFFVGSLQLLSFTSIANTFIPKGHAVIGLFTRILCTCYVIVQQNLSYSEKQLRYRFLYEFFVSKMLAIWLITLPPVYEPGMHIYAVLC